MGNQKHKAFAITYTFQENHRIKIEQLLEFLRKKLGDTDEYIAVEEIGVKENIHIHLLLRVWKPQVKTNLKRKLLLEFYKKFGNDMEIEYNKINSSNFKISHNQEYFIGVYMMKQEEVKIVLQNLDLEKEKKKALTWISNNAHRNPNLPKLKNITLDNLVSLIMGKIEDKVFQSSLFEPNIKRIFYKEKSPLQYSRRIFKIIIKGLIKEKYNFIHHFKRLEQIHNQLYLYYNNGSDGVEDILDMYFKDYQN